MEKQCKHSMGKASIRGVQLSQITHNKPVDKFGLNNILFPKSRFNFEVTGINKKFSKIYQTLI